MSYEELFRDLKAVEDQPPVIPEGDYTAVVTGAYLDSIETEDGTREVIRVNLTFQGNPNTFLTDGNTPVDGQVGQLTIFLPSPEDHNRPAQFSRGTMYDVSLRRLKRFFKACGVNLEDESSLEEALQKCQDATVIVHVVNRLGQDGMQYDQIQYIVSGS